MITIKYSDNLITVKGHANFDDYGKDIVCASVSSIITTTINSIMSLNSNSIKYSDDGNTLTIEKIDNNDTTNTLLSVMISLISDLSNKYPDNIELKEEK